MQQVQKDLDGPTNPVSILKHFRRIVCIFAFKTNYILKVDIVKEL